MIYTAGLEALHAREMREWQNAIAVAVSHGFSGSVPYGDTAGGVDRLSEQGSNDASGEWEDVSALRDAGLTVLEVA